MQSPIADEIVTLVDQIITVQGQISEQFPQIFENIVKENLAKNITSSLNNIYQTQSLALQNLREIEDLETKLSTSEFYMIPIYPCPKINVYPVPPQEENEIVSAQTQNDEIDENPENDDQEQMVVDLKKEELSITIENNTTDDTIEKPNLFQIKEKIDYIW